MASLNVPVSMQAETLLLTSVDWQTLVPWLVGSDVGRGCEHPVLERCSLAECSASEGGDLAGLGHGRCRLHLRCSCLAAAIASRHGQRLCQLCIVCLRSKTISMLSIVTAGTITTLHCLPIIDFGHCNCWRHIKSALFAYAIRNICAEWAMTASRQYGGKAGLRDLVIAMSYTHGLSLHGQLGMQSAGQFIRCVAQTNSCEHLSSSTCAISTHGIAK